jgi:predicted O-methyltransferase YrrM
VAHATLNLTADLYGYFQTVAFDEPPILAELRARTREVSGAAMQITPEQGAFMAMLVRLTGARLILEFGTYTGYSSLAMALAGPDVRVVASDVSAEWTAIAREFWAKAGVQDRIELRLAPGTEVIAALAREGRTGQFDLAFIDADKANYDSYYEGALRLLRTGGLVLIDNVLWGGDVADSAKTDADTTAIRALNDKVRRDTRVDFCMVPIGDGLTLARKR